MVNEIYVCDGPIVKSKYVLMIDDNGGVSLKFYVGQNVITEHKPVLIKFMQGIRIEYGMPNSLGTRSVMRFINYENGQLNEKWTKIK